MSDARFTADVVALAAEVANELDAVVSATAEYRCAARTAVALADGTEALARAREQLRAAGDRVDLALTSAQDPRPFRAELSDAARAAADLYLWVVCLEREHLRARLELARRRDEVRRESVRTRRADVAARCGAHERDLLLLDAVDARLGAMLA